MFGIKLIRIKKGEGEIFVAWRNFFWN